MRKTKVTEIVYKPFAEKLINIMKLQLEKPKSQQRWDRVFRGKGAPINAQTKNVYRGINQQNLKVVNNIQFLKLITLLQLLK